MKPLDGVKVLEMAGLAPSPFCGMMLADFGAEVIVVDRISQGAQEIPNVMPLNPFDRGKRSIRIELKSERGMEILRRIIQGSDVLIEPYRPGVMERLGMGPDQALALNERLIYARLTGWGQEGPYKKMAGHDINYIGLSGALSLFRRRGERPLPPCNILGDFAGGGMLCAIGVLLALIERRQSGKGQVVDAAMVDGTALLATLFYGLLANRFMTLEIGTNLFDGGAPFYQAYETEDGRFMAVGAIESRFYGRLLEGLDLDPTLLPHQYDMERWPEMKERLAAVFRTKTRAAWTAIFETKDACVAPILELDEVPSHPHNRHRGLLLEVEGVMQPAPAPRLSRTPGKVEKAWRARGAETREILAEAGYPEEEIEKLLKERVVAQAE